MDKIQAEWSGCYPNLCRGKWTLIVNDEDVSDLIPEEKQDSDMNTIGEYQHWHFEDWKEIFTSYEDGLDKDTWIKTNKEWLDRITDNKETQEKIFYAIQKEDFRPCSCGGCI